MFIKLVCFWAKMVKPSRTTQSFKQMLNFFNNLYFFFLIQFRSLPFYHLIKVEGGEAPNKYS